MKGQQFKQQRHSASKQRHEAKRRVVAKKRQAGRTTPPSSRRLRHKHNFQTRHQAAETLAAQIFLAELFGLGRARRLFNVRKVA